VAYFWVHLILDPRPTATSVSDPRASAVCPPLIGPLLRTRFPSIDHEMKRCNSTNVQSFFLLAC
jgi:hypothetical protein